MARALLGVQIVALLGCFIACAGGSGTQLQIAPPPKADPETLTKQRDFIEKLQRQGYLQKIENEYAWVTPKFLALDFSEKKLFAEAMWCFVFQVGSDAKSFPATWLLGFKHSKTGKRIGHYHPVGGLALD